MGNDDVFDFLISDQKEVFLIMHARETEPDNPAVRLDEKAGIVELYRSKRNGCVFMEKIRERRDRKRTYRRAAFRVRCGRVDCESRRRKFYC